ncbi:MAG: phosphatase PAP2 family protein [Saprospiraceae bacterium]|nr:phosphatase PAP2 family protein [Saprospiraceae bacterium]
MNRAYFKGLLNENARFFICFIIFLILGAITLFFIQQGDEIFFFSNHRSAFGNLFFTYFTRLGEGLIFVGLTLIFLFVRYRTAMFVPLMGLTVMLVTFLSKKAFSHPRPWLYFQQLNITDQINLVEGVEVHSGANGFPSGHTMAAFALYTFLALILPQKRGVAILLFTTALLVGVSRIYLVQHFFKDVYLGAIIGVIIAVIFHYLHHKYPKRNWAEKYLKA